MHYCLICERKYKTIESYNDHLNRKQHKTNVMKLESIYAVNKYSGAYKQWKLNRKMFDTKKDTDNQTSG